MRRTNESSICAGISTNIRNFHLKKKPKFEINEKSLLLSEKVMAAVVVECCEQNNK